jgi:sarcosine oxidase gamma subunit
MAPKLVQLFALQTLTALCSQYVHAVVEGQGYGTNLDVGGVQSDSLSGVNDGTAILLKLDVGECSIGIHNRCRVQLYRLGEPVYSVLVVLVCRLHGQLKSNAV